MLKSKCKKLYKCDPNKNIRCKKTNCYQYGGECKRTTNKQFRKRWFFRRRNYDTD